MRRTGFLEYMREVWAEDINMEAISIWVFKVMTLDDHQGNRKRKVNQGLSTSTSKVEDESIILNKAISEEGNPKNNFLEGGECKKF